VQTCKLIEQPVFQKKKNSMNSINQQQPENNHEDLRGKEAIEKMREIIDKAQTCFFCTSSTNGTPMAVRPMSVQQLDDEGNLWFLSANDSHTNSEIATDNTVQLLFQASAHSGFLTIDGKATISTDKQKIKELWEPVIKTWFTGGVDDPRITVIKVIPQTGYYWDNKHGNMVAGIKMLIGAATGKTLDDSIEGKIVK
jgi:general stress protein 26